MIRINVKAHVGPLNNLIGNFSRRAGKAIANGARNICEDAKSFAPKDTGALSETITYVTPGHDGRQTAAANAVALYSSKYGARTSNQSPIIMPGYFAPKPRRNHQAFVIAGTFYAAWVETGNSRTPAQPYMEPAMQKNRAALLYDIHYAFQQSGRDANR